MSGSKMNTIICMLGLLVTAVSAAEHSSESMPVSGADTQGKLSLDARLFYFDREFDLPDADPARAFNAGGIIKYETASLNGFKLAGGFYGSFNLFGIVDRELGAGTAMLQDDNEDIAFMGEAYVDYAGGDHQLKAGRQRLATPLINDRDFRMLPSAFEALVYRNKGLSDTLLEAAYVYSETGFGSTLNNFERQTDLWGQDGLAYIYTESLFKTVSLRAQFVGTLESSGLYRDFSYVDANVPLAAGQGSFFKLQAGSTGYQQQDRGNMFGLKLGSRLVGVDMSVVYNQIRGNPFSAVEAGPLFTDWQQGYANYEPSDAIGFQLGYSFSERFKISGGYVDIKSIGGDEYNLDSYAESVFDLFYFFGPQSHIRLRYSDKDQNADSDLEDRQDFRLIYYYEI